MYRSILVPLDGSSFAEQALPMASDLAGRAGAGLHLALVHQNAATLPGPGEPIVLDPGIDERMRAEELNYLASVTRLVAPSGKPPVTSALLDGPVAEAIATEAHARLADLVVMTTHGRGVFSRLWLGSVADRLVRMLEQPVLLLRPNAAKGMPQPDAVKSILVPLDGSALSESILEPATTLARTLGAQVVLLRVLERLAPVWLPTPGIVPVPEPDMMPHRQAEAQQQLAPVAARLREQGLTVRTVIEFAPEPVAAILELVERESIDLVALATHGRGGPTRLLLGSVADKLVRSASVPLLVWRPRAAVKEPAPASATAFAHA